MTMGVMIARLAVPRENIMMFSWDIVRADKSFSRAGQQYSM